MKFHYSSPGHLAVLILSSLAMLFSLACSRPAGQSTQTASSSGQPDKSSNSVANDDGSISFAKHPERFVKEPIVAPPFNLSNPRTATDFFDVGVHEDTLQHYEKAIAAYQEAMKLKPDWALLCVRAGKDYRRLKQQDNAVAQFKRATRIDPHYWDAYSELALTYKDAGDTNHAIEAASKLLDFAPLQLPVHNQLGYWYEEIGDRQRARQQFEIYRDLAAKTEAERRTERYDAAVRELQKLSN